LGWVGVQHVGWVGLGLYFGGLGWVGFQKVDPCPCLHTHTHPTHIIHSGIDKISPNKLKYATHFMQGLNARNMYNGCNLLRVDFSKLAELSVRFNNDKTRDFTNPLLPSGDSQTASSSALGDQRVAATALAAIAHQGTPTARSTS